MTQDFNYEEELSKCKTMQDITGQDGLVQKIIKDAVGHVLGMEMEDFILQEKEKGSSVLMEILGFRYRVPGKQGLNLTS